MVMASRSLIQDHKLQTCHVGVITNQLQKKAHKIVEFSLTTKPSLPFCLLIRLHQSLISALDFGNLKNEIPVGFLSLLTKQLLEQPKAAHFLPNELPVLFIITGNICSFF